MNFARHGAGARNLRLIGDREQSPLVVIGHRGTFYWLLAQGAWRKGPRVKGGQGPDVGRWCRAEHLLSGCQDGHQGSVIVTSSGKLDTDR